MVRSDTQIVQHIFSNIEIMCYSAESSLLTFSLVSTICFYLWTKGGAIRTSLAIILFFISLMQLLEFFIWLHLDCSSTNRWISRLIPVLLFLQPVIVLLTLLYFQSGRLPSLFYQVLLILWLFCFPLFIMWMNRGWNQCTTVGKMGHLEWPYANSSDVVARFMQTAYNVILVLGIGSLNTTWYGLWYVLLASYSYLYTKKRYGHSWGSVWCHVVNVLALAALLVS